MDARDLTYCLHFAAVQRQLGASPAALRQSQHRRDYALRTRRTPAAGGGTTHRPLLGRLYQWVRHVLGQTAPRRLRREPTPGTAAQR